MRDKSVLDQLVDRDLGPWFAHPRMLLARLGRPFAELMVAASAGKQHDICGDEVQPVAGLNLPQAFPGCTIDGKEVATTPLPPNAIGTD